MERENLYAVKEIGLLSITLKIIQCKSSGGMVKCSTQVLPL